MIPIAATLAFLVLATALSWIDLKTLRLPDSIVAALFVVGVAYGLTDWGQGVLQVAIGALIGSCSLLTIALVFQRLRQIDGLGGGDVKLAGALGAWVGPWGIAPMVAAASLAALLFVGLLALIGSPVGRETRIPFGPFLLAAGFVCWTALFDPLGLGPID